MLDDRINLGAVAEVVLARLMAAPGGKLGRSRLVHELAPYSEHRLSPAEWREVIERVLHGMSDRGLMSEAASSVTLARKGRSEGERLLARKPGRLSWPDVRDGELIARALGLTTGHRQRAWLRRGAGLRAAVLSRALGLKPAECRTPATMRDALFQIAVRRGLAERSPDIASGAGERRRIAALLVGHRHAAPTTDAGLVAEVAADQIGARGTSPAALRLQILRQFIGTGGNTASGLRLLAPPRLFPDPGEFAGEVRNFARRHAQGWQGNRRALISAVWPEISGAHPEWGLDVTRYKSLLTDAHRAGRLSLVNADLRDKGSLPDLEASAVAYRNTVWHFIRVEDEKDDNAA